MRQAGPLGIALDIPAHCGDAVALAAMSGGFLLAISNRAVLSSRLPVSRILSALSSPLAVVWLSLSFSDRMIA